MYVDVYTHIAPRRTAPRWEVLPNLQISAHAHRTLNSLCACYIGGHISECVLHRNMPGRHDELHRNMPSRHDELHRNMPGYHSRLGMCSGPIHVRALIRCGSSSRILHMYVYICIDPLLRPPHAQARERTQTFVLFPRIDCL